MKTKRMHKKKRICRDEPHIAEDLPDEMLCQIFAFLEASDLFLGVSRVCQRWNQVVISGGVLHLDIWYHKQLKAPKDINLFIPNSNTSTSMIFKKAKALGRDFFEKRDWTKAVLHFSRAVLLYPKDHMIFFWRGFANAELSNFQEALDDFSKSLILDPNDSTTLSNRGATYRDVGNHAKALEDLQLAIKFDPMSASAHNNMGVVFGDLGRISEAVDQYSKALDLDPWHIIALKNRGRRLQKMGMMEDARRDFVKLQQFNASDPEVLKFFIKMEKIQKTIEEEVK